MNIYVGNLTREIAEEDLRKAFEAFGQVASINIIKDRFTGEPRGFGFVDMPSKEEGRAAIAGLNHADVNGVTLTVNEARPRSEGGGGGGGRGGHMGGGGRKGGFGGGGGRRF